jgi:Domain of unknown function (DUF4286)
MILYNVTVGIDKGIETEWISWIKRHHIPAVLNTGLFTGHKFYKVLTHDDEGSASYCIQYFTPDLLKFNYYLEHHAHAIVEEHRLQFADRHVVFNTLLEEVD